MQTIDFENYFEIKNPLIYLNDVNGDIVWFYDYQGNIVCLEKILFDCPKWVICIQTKEEMIQNFKKSIKEGKCIEFLDQAIKDCLIVK